MFLNVLEVLGCCFFCVLQLFLMLLDALAAFECFWECLEALEFFGSHWRTFFGVCVVVLKVFLVF